MAITGLAAVGAFGELFCANAGASEYGDSHNPIAATRTAEALEDTRRPLDTTATSHRLRWTNLSTLVDGHGRRVSLDALAPTVRAGDHEALCAVSPERAYLAKQ